MGRSLAEKNFGSTAQRILQHLKLNTGFAFSIEQLYGVVERLPSEVRVELENLTHAGLIDRQASTGGPVTYLVPGEDPSMHGLFPATSSGAEPSARTAMQELSTIGA